MHTPEVAAMMSAAAGEALATEGEEGMSTRRDHWTGVVETARKQASPTENAVRSRGPSEGSSSALSGAASRSERRLEVKTSGMAVVAVEPATRAPMARKECALTCEKVGVQNGREALGGK